MTMFDEKALIAQMEQTLEGSMLTTTTTAMTEQSLLRDSLERTIRRKTSK